MKANRPRTAGRERARRRRLMVETLEPRVVLDAGLGIEAAGIASADLGVERFESTEELRHLLVNTAVDRWGHLFGTTGKQSTLFHEDIIVSRPALTKTDGEYLYIVQGRSLSIIDARNPVELSLVAEIPLDWNTRELFVSGDRLMLLSNQYASVPSHSNAAVWFPNGDLRPQTSVLVYDIADRMFPELIHETAIDGELATARQIGDKAYLVTTHLLDLPPPGYLSPPPVYLCIDTPLVSFVATLSVADSGVLSPEGEQTSVGSNSCPYETEEAYLARVEDSLIERAMPSFETIDASGGVIASGIISEPTDIYKPLTDRASHVTSILVFDLASDDVEIASSTSLFTDAGSFGYASAQNIYIAVGTHDSDNHLATNLHKFSIGGDGTTIELTAIGTVPGWVVNQSSVDEHGGYLRIVTSATDRTNQLFVLEQQDTRLDIVGSIDDIAQQDSVVEVRFVGDKALVATTKGGRDRLFTIDLSNPTDPSIASELAIQESVLYPISEDFILAFGSVVNQFAWEPYLTLLDISDVAVPTEVAGFRFENEAAWYGGLYPRAFSYFPDSQIAVVPFLQIPPILGCICEQPGPTSSFWVIHVDTASEDESLQLVGKVRHDGTPLRSLLIGDNLFTVSTSTVTVTNLLNPTTPIGQLYIGPLKIRDDYFVLNETHENELDVLKNDRVSDEVKIVHVGAATAPGAVVTISEDGKRLQYTLPANFDPVRDSFDYTVEGIRGRRTATVSVTVLRQTRDRIVELAKTDLHRGRGLSGSWADIRLREVTEQEWPDSCLGVASEGDVCAQVVTPGFRIVFDYLGAQFVYHSDKTDRVVRANDPIIPEPSETGDLIQFRAEIVNAAGEAVTSLLAGEEATLQIYADDLRGNPRGVFAAYFDVMFDPAQVAKIGPISHSDGFGNLRSGTIGDDGLIDEVGGLNLKADASRTLVVSIPITAAGPGELRFTLGAADILPTHDVWLLGRNSAIPSDQIRFGEVVVEVIDSLHNETNPMDTNMDGQMTPLDALIVIDHLHRHGAGPVNADAIRALRTAAAEAHAVRFAVDVNGDGFISPVDVLMIVNEFNKPSGVLAEGEAVAGQDTASNATPIVPLPVTAAAESRATLPRLAARRVDTSPPMDLDDRFPSADTLEYVARAHTHRATPSEDATNEDTFFAELELAAGGDWWQN